MHKQSSESGAETRDSEMTSERTARAKDSGCASVNIGTSSHLSVLNFSTSHSVLGLAFLALDCWNISAPEAKYSESMSRLYPESHLEILTSVFIKSQERVLAHHRSLSFNSFLYVSAKIAHKNENC